MGANLELFVIEVISGASGEYHVYELRHLSKEEAHSLFLQSFQKSLNSLERLKSQEIPLLTSFRGKLVPTLDLLFNTVVHQAEHCAQIISLAKLRLGERYQPLTHPYLVFSNEQYQVSDK